MSNPPLVAVLTPAYNAAEFLEATIACVQAQNYPNIVHIILDNASSDDTPKIIERNLNGRVPILTFRNETTLPQKANWNKTASLAPPEAKYIQWLCADDLIRKDAISKMVALAEANPDVTVVSGIDVFGDELRPPIAIPKDCPVVDGRAFVAARLKEELRWFAWQCFFLRREAYNFGPHVFEEKAFSIDTTLVLKNAARGKVGFVHEPMIYTRWHASTVTARLVKESPATLLVQTLQYLIQYGTEILEPRELEVALGRAVRRLLCQRLYLRLRYGAPTVELIDETLREAGVHPGPMDYVAAVLEFPLHRVRIAALKRAERALGGGTRITEEEFVASPDTPQSVT